MTAPLATTTLRVERPAAAEPYETATYETVASGVRGHISGPRGSEGGTARTQEDVAFPFGCDPVDVSHLDRIVDEATDEVYEVVWARQRAGLGLDHVVGELRQVTGAP